MPKSITAVYSGMLREPNLSPEHQKRIFNYALARQEETLLLTLLRHPLLTDELDQRFAMISDPKIRGAWYSRPGRDPKVIEDALESEKSLIMLGNLAALELPEHAYKTLALTGGAKISEALLGNPNASRESKLIAAARWAKGFRLQNPEKVKNVVSLYIDGDPELALVALKEATSIPLISALSAIPGIPEDATEDLLKRMFEAMCRQALSAPVAGYDSRHYYRIGYYKPYYSSFDPLREMIHTRPMSVKLRKRISDFVSNKAHLKSVKNPTVWQLQCESIKDELRNVRPARPASAKTSQASAKTGFDEACSRKNAQQIMHYLTRPGATVAMAKKAARSITYGVSPGDVKGIPQDLLCAFFVTKPRFISESVLTSIERPAELILDMLRSEKSRDPLLLGVCINSRFLSYDALLEFPVSFLATGKLPLYIHQMYGKALLSAFGESDAAWEIFESLSDEFEGTFAELLNTANALA